MCIRDSLDDLAELRGVHVSSAFFTGLSPAEQGDWVSDLVGRTDAPADGAPAICVLDTGVNRGHPLLERALEADDAHTCDPSWGASDHDGHGTQMAGLALYGDVAEALATAERVRLRHRLESVKILPPANDTDPDLYGAVTALSLIHI